MRRIAATKQSKRQVLDRFDMKTRLPVATDSESVTLLLSQPVGYLSGSRPGFSVPGPVRSLILEQKLVELFNAPNQWF